MPLPSSKSCSCSKSNFSSSSSSRVVDAGAGVGRITKHVLLQRYGHVHLVEGDFGLVQAFARVLGQEARPVGVPLAAYDWKICKRTRHFWRTGGRFCFGNSGRLQYMTDGRRRGGPEEESCRRMWSTTPACSSSRRIAPYVWRRADGSVPDGHAVRQWPVRHHPGGTITIGTCCSKPDGG
jgi:hypothetical protein